MVNVKLEANEAQLISEIKSKRYLAISVPWKSHGSKEN